MVGAELRWEGRGGNHFVFVLAVCEMPGPSTVDSFEYVDLGRLPVAGRLLPADGSITDRSNSCWGG
jgi:hypothetical protein